MAGRYNNVRDFFMVTAEGVDWIFEVADSQSAPAVGVFRLFDFLAFGVGRDTFENNKPFNLVLVRDNWKDGPNDDRSLEALLTQALRRGFVRQL